MLAPMAVRWVLEWFEKPMLRWMMGDGLLGVERGEGRSDGAGGSGGSGGIGGAD